MACSDDFVDVDSQDENSENFFNSEEDYQNALIAAYDPLQSTYLNVMLGEIASDNTLAGGESAIDVPGIQEIDDMIHTPVNQQLRDIWSWMYGGVNRANFILEFQDKTDFPGKEGVIAQARFLRAYYNFDSALGLIYEVDVTKPEGEMLKIISMADGMDFHQDKKYKVAVNSYRGNGGGNHLTAGAGIPARDLQDRIINSTDKDLRYYMMKWIEEQGTIDPKPMNQWRIVPDEYFRAGKARDYPILFRN